MCPEKYQHIVIWSRGTMWNNIGSHFPRRTEKNSPSKLPQFSVVLAACIRLHNEPSVHPSIYLSIYIVESEGTVLLDILANQHSRWNKRIRGDILLNGSHISIQELGRRISYAREDTDFTTDMTVRQTLLFTSYLVKPGHKARRGNLNNKVSTAYTVRSYLLIR